jgi:hypothetical protein
VRVLWPNRRYLTTSALNVGRACVSSPADWQVHADGNISMLSRREATQGQPLNTAGAYQYLCGPDDRSPIRVRQRRRPSHGPEGTLLRVLQRLRGYFQLWKRDVDGSKARTPGGPFPLYQLVTSAPRRMEPRQPSGAQLVRQNRLICTFRAVKKLIPALHEVWLAFFWRQCDAARIKTNLWLSIISKCLSGWGLYFFHNSRRCSFLSRRSWQICLRSFIRALRSSWRIWLCATKSACFSDPRENDQN